MAKQVSTCGRGRFLSRAQEGVWKATVSFSGANWCVSSVQQACSGGVMAPLSGQHTAVPPPLAVPFANRQQLSRSMRAQRTQKSWSPTGSLKWRQCVRVVGCPCSHRHGNPGLPKFVIALQGADWHVASTGMGIRGVTAHGPPSENPAGPPVSSPK